MATALTATRDSNGYNRRIYKAAADEHKAELLSADISNRVDVVANISRAGRVVWSDMDDVRRRTVQYFDACAAASVFPTVEGLTVQAYGVSRQALNQYLHAHGKDEAAEYINMVKDEMADILVQASLANNANPVQAIFQLKNHYNYADRIDIKPVNEADPIQEHTDEEIRRKYAMLAGDE